MRKYHIYIITNKNNTVLYTGVTSNLTKRIYQHKVKAYKSFSSRYNCNKLVYFEEHSNMRAAIAREKQIKAGSRRKKEQLINSINPEWNDLSDGWLFYFS
ncbi:GIY-YIG nuclease family protein [Leptobacterium flavescens]|uniref:GIY-YIG nuclease family protein n=1 Tax=Leptobacterium flavescens TaxID=472055 RepID=A0A6P0UJN0_9FLAO|nr:GIY-YIG nuclease family protein [Leptobacterium flavescens]NER13571.1 GIY-YIG nuclease family protein [Leptobacterium flavescens]